MGKGNGAGNGYGGRENKYSGRKRKDRRGYREIDNTREEKRKDEERKIWKRASRDKSKQTLVYNAL